MTAKNYIKKIRGNRHTYKNIDHLDIERYKNLYKYIKKNQHREIFEGSINKIDFLLNRENEISFLKKYQAMEMIINNLKK